MEKNFINTSFSKKLKSMLNVDFKRLSVSPFFYVMVGISLVVPILILVMTTMMDGVVTNNPQTGLPGEPMQGFDYVWQILGSLSGTSVEQSGMTMDLVSMCNINMMFFAVAVFVCIFISEDFRSGYAKNLFSVRARKTDYVISKSIVCFAGSACMFIAFFIGAIIGGAVADLPFTMQGFNGANLVFCMLSKIFLIPVFVSIFTLMSVIAKQKSWLAICLSLGVGMLLFMMISTLTPLNANIVNVLASIAGSVLFAVGMGAISNLVLKKTSLI
ncbi:MAG: ABC transporter permease [Clostridia bacterium]|nr:ABC transporter permease [Clostridia bacterium]